jgi:hypothetical protein
MCIIPSPSRWDTIQDGSDVRYEDRVGDGGVWRASRFVAAVHVASVAVLVAFDAVCGARCVLLSV